MRCPWAQWQVCISSLRWVETPPLLALFLLSPLSFRPYLFISVRLIFVVVSVDSVLSGGAHLPSDLRSLNSASQGKADRWGGGQRDHLWWSVYCPAPICRGPQYNIHSIMHNTKNQSWVKDNSKEYRLGLDDGTGREAAESRAWTVLGCFCTARISVWKRFVC